ncbi:MAG: PstS family phosphate ABC transporter substrate-binding protein [Fibromonadales bacterium]|nr:PstS family phosphate ABC transporter substrate-binding protein [Fibromonadales bacterium]
MKKLLLVAILATASILAAQTIKGSDTVLPLSQQQAETYMKVNKNAKVTVTGGGSGVGISALIEGTTDIAQSSRKIKFDEKKKLSDKGSSVVEKIIAYDALAVVVNPKNTVSQLTREQLDDIFTGKITNWKEVGGADLKITPIARETSSGTYEFFKEEVLQKKDYVAGIMSVPATGTIIETIKKTPGAIGYVGLAYLNKNVKALKVSFKDGQFVEPSVKTAKDETYPIVRPLIYYYVQSSEAAVKPFIDYVLSKEGQKIVSTVGFITIH